MINQKMNKFELIKTLKDICQEVTQKHQNVTIDFDITIDNSYTHQEIFYQKTINTNLKKTTLQLVQKIFIIQKQMPMETFLLHI